MNLNILQNLGDGYYYALSSIAQSFAAILALNGVFIIYKIQSLIERKRSALSNLRSILYKDLGGDSGHPEDRRRAKEISPSYDDQQLLKWALNEKGEKDIIQQKKAMLNEYDICDIMLTKIKVLLRAPLIINGVVLSVSLVLIPIKNYLNNMIENIIIILIVLFALIAVTINVKSILVMMKEKTEKKNDKKIKKSA
jgi:hypothetical protein